ncbi:MAG: hypothetical protein OJF47_002212 [Nitrospira sp.]|jgi:hypothetical protein|nr:MAG: hypothetical protein OJF47_002212 [Nitrospira sp.]
MLRLRDNQWERIREHSPEEHVPDSRPGRKPVPAWAIRRRLVERVLVRLQWKRRLLIRWEYSDTSFLGFVRRASITMLPNQC